MIRRFFSTACHRYGIFALFIWLPLTASIAENTAKEAYELYQQGEQYFLQKDYRQAMTYFNKAVALHNRDGNLLLGYTEKETTEAMGRTVRRVIKREKILVDYRPGARIEAIENLLLEKRRKADPPRLKISSMMLKEPSDNGILDGGEKGHLIIEVVNEGNTPALGVYLQSETENSNIDIEEMVYVGEVRPRANKRVEIPVAATRKVNYENVKVRVTGREKAHYDSNVLEIVFRANPYQPAKLTVKNTTYKDVSRDGRVVPMEIIEIEASVANSGDGIAEQVIARVKLGKFVHGGHDYREEYKLGFIAPNKEKRIKFSVYADRNIKPGHEIPVVVEVAEKNASHIVQAKLDLKVHNDGESIVMTPDGVGDIVEIDSEVNVDAIIPKGTETKPNGVAVIIGNRDYSKYKLPQVNYAIQDAKVVKKYVVTTLGYTTENVIYREDATMADFSQIFGTRSQRDGMLKRAITPGESDVFVYYSGHGAPSLKNKSAFFVPVDSDPNFIEISGYRLETLYENLARLDARSIVVVLDACFSGSSDGGPVIKSVSPIMIVPKFEASPKNSIVFTSSKRDQLSLWYHKKQHGLFTYFFLRGLGGEADANKDLKIHSHELAGYLKRHVPAKGYRIKGYRQMPSVVQSTDLVLASFPK